MSQTPQKHCGGCDRDLPRTPEFFYVKKKAGRFVPSSRCRECSIKRSLERYHANEGVRARQRMQVRKWRAENAARARELNRLTWLRSRDARRAKIAEIRASPAGRLRLNQRSRLSKLRAKHGLSESITLDASIGCSWEDFALHLERQWGPGMSWENYGSWHIDHIVPIAAVDLTDAAAAAGVLHYSNCRPLWGHENHKKGAKVSALAA